MLQKVPKNGRVCQEKFSSILSDPPVGLEILSKRLVIWVQRTYIRLYLQSSG